ATGDRRARDALVAALVAEPLGAGRPPWRLHLIRGGGTAPDAVVVLLHRALADGAGPLDVLRGILDPAAGVPEPGPAAVLPAPAPPAVAVPPAPTGAAPSRHGFGTATLPLDRVREVARAAGVRLTALLAALAGDAAAEAAAEEGTAPPGAWTLRVAVSPEPFATPPGRGRATALDGPAALDGPDGTGGARWLDVPVDARPLRERLAGVRRTAGDRPPAGRAPFAGAAVATLRGPSGPLLLAGAPLGGLHPILPPARGVPIAVAALSRDGALHVSVIAETRAVPAPDRFAAGLLRAFEKLAAEFGVDAGPGRSGAQTGTP
ncbi:MAG TPA: wax ester/triacylglycerol synthase domain-containing protein, partial [Spirillospora sp.]|nr:wax ester/triacylglycerol synthase domain-containing protein [Spirillospora sp.]